MFSVKVGPMEVIKKQLLWWCYEQGITEFWIKDPPKERVTLEKEVSFTKRGMSLEECKTLEELRKALLAFEGCALKSTALHTVFGAGNPKSPIMLVGEAPGAEEDKQGKPFVGMSGQLLDKMFSTIGFSRKDLYISNILPWRPPGNRQPSSEEISACFPFIERHISLICPKILVFIGGVSLKALMKTSKGITFFQGKSLFYTNPFLSSPIQAFALYHPAYLLRSPSQKRMTWRSLLSLQSLLKEVKILPL